MIDINKDGVYKYKKVIERSQGLNNNHCSSNGYPEVPDLN